MTDSDEVKLLPCPLERLAEHLSARPFLTGDGDNIRGVAGWLDYSLNRCGLVVVEEQSLTRPPVVTDEVVERDETGWLIEEDANGIPLWIALAENAWPRTEVKDRRLGARGSRSFERYLSPVVRVKDANDALRFARKQDAEAVIKLFDRFLLNPVATEHEWPLASMPAVVSGGQT